MTLVRHFISRRDATFWVGFFLIVASLILSFMPLSAITKLGIILSPVSTLHEKTVLLFWVLRPAILLLGIVGIGWGTLSVRRRRAFIDHAYRTVASSSWALPVILGLAMIIRLGWVMYFPTVPYADSEWYFRTASELAAGHGFVYDLESRAPLAAWPIGYPAFLSLLFRFTGPSTLVARIANVVLGTIIVWLTYCLAARMFSRGVALVSAALISILPGLFTYSSLITTDVLFVVLVILVIYLTIRNDARDGMAHSRMFLHAGLAGISCGMLILTRPTGLTLLPLWVFLRWMIVDRNLVRLGRWTLVMLIGAFLVVAPWTMRNYLRFNRLIIVSNNGGVNFWIGNNPLANGAFIFPRDPAVNPLLPLIGDEIAVEETGYRLGLEFVREQPDRALALLPAKVFYLYNSNDFGLVWNRASATTPGQPGTGLHMFVLTNVIYTLVSIIALLSLFMLWLRRARFLPQVWLGVILTIYWTIVHLPFFGQDRFALPLLPFLTTYAAYGIVAFAKPMDLDEQVRPDP
jgi:4-amino-4-deoxy-L-arabinose transferase-like glycosyltransferase